MASFSKFYKASFDAVKARILTVVEYGPKTAVQVAPYGDDSNPVQGMDAIYMETDNDDEPIVVGFVNTGLLAGAGEKRIFSQKTNKARDISFYIWLRNDGTCSIGGEDDNLVRYKALNIAQQEHIAKLEGELVKIAAGIALAGGSYSPGDISLDISAAKIEEIKTL